MPLAQTSRILHRVQRRRLRSKRYMAWLRWLGKRLVWLVLCTGLVWVGMVVLPFLLQSAYFQVQSIPIHGAQSLSPQDIRYLLAIPADASLLQLDLPRMGSRLARHPSIRAVSLRRRLPDTLVVTIQEHDPYLMVRSEGQRVVLDSAGTVLRAAVPEHDAALPELVLQQPRALTPGVRLEQPEVHRAMALLRTYYASPIVDIMRLASFTVQASGTSVWRVEPQGFFLHLGEGEIDSQLGRLSWVLRYITQQNLTVRAIDLSYHQRIIVTPAS